MGYIIFIVLVWGLTMMATMAIGLVFVLLSKVTKSKYIIKGLDVIIKVLDFLTFYQSKIDD